MAESSLTSEYADIHREVGRYLGYGRLGAGENYTGDDLQDVLDCVNSALRRVYFPTDPKTGRAYRWTWLFAESTITTVAPYAGDTAAGGDTITVTNGAVIFDDTATNTWPTWAANGELSFSGVAYTVASRNANGDELVLDDTTVDATAVEFKLGQHRFQLADDFFALDSPLTYRSGEATYFPPVRIGNESDIRTWRQSVEYYYHPVVCAVVPRTFDPTVGQRWDLLLGPTPDTANTFNYRYVRLPNTIDTTNKYHGGGASISELVLTASLAEADMKFNDGGPGAYERRFREELFTAIQMDRVAHTPVNHGYLMDPNESLDYFNSVSAIYMDYARQLEAVSL